MFFNDRIGRKRERMRKYPLAEVRGDRLGPDVQLLGPLGRLGSRHRVDFALDLGLGRTLDEGVDAGHGHDEEACVTVRGKGSFLLELQRSAHATSKETMC